ncbi:MAG: hypothetical protein V4525_12500 [Pseudomonadota bacterium]
MRVILLGSELRNLATAHHLAELGYEITILEIQSERDVKEKYEQKEFIDYFEKKLKNLGVKFKQVMKVKKFITECEVVRGLSVINEKMKPEILVAERFVLGADKESSFILKALKIYVPSQFKPFRNKQYFKPFMGKSQYSNLFVNRACNNSEPLFVSESGKLLADFIYNPSFTNHSDINNAKLQHKVKNNNSINLAVFSFFQKQLKYN